MRQRDTSFINALRIRRGRRHHIVDNLHVHVLAGTCMLRACIHVKYIRPLAGPQAGVLLAICTVWSVGGFCLSQRHPKPAGTACRCSLPLAFKCSIIFVL